MQKCILENNTIIRKAGPPQGTVSVCIILCSKIQILYNALLLPVHQCRFVTSISKVLCMHTVKSDSMCVGVGVYLCANWMFSLSVCNHWSLKHMESKYRISWKKGHASKISFVLSVSRSPISDTGKKLHIRVHNYALHAVTCSSLLIKWIENPECVCTTPHQGLIPDLWDSSFSL